MLCIIVSNYCMAKDIIVTRGAEKIDAKITEISQTEFKYKKANDLKGPTFAIGINDISTIIYENGDIQTFKKERNTDTNSSDSIITKHSLSGKLYYSKIDLPDGTKKYRYHNEDNTIVMSSNEYGRYSKAKDVIITKDCEIIKAKIIEVSKTEVKYKKAINTQGPSYILSTNDISTIIFENGNVQMFSDNNEKKLTDTNSAKQTNAISPEIQVKKSEPTLQEKQATQTQQINPATQTTSISTKNNQVAERPVIYYSKITLPNGKRRRRYHDKESTIILRNKEFKKIVYAECPIAKKHWRKANVWGSIAIPMDFICLPVGGLFTIISLHHSHKILPSYNEYCTSKE